MYRLLIVDDEPLMRRGIRSLATLQELGVTTIDEATNGEEALTLVEAGKPDLVFLDINMPKMDGLTFVKGLKDMSPHTRVCMITGYDYFEYVREALRAGVDEYLLKPVSKEEIQGALSKMIQGLVAQQVSREVGTLSHQIAASQADNQDEITAAIEAHIYDSQLSLSVLADTLGYSANYLGSLIKERYGIPFQDYVIKRRMQQAKLLLLTTDLKNYQISEAVGIEDVNYFATRFKKTFNMTPKEFRIKVKGSV